MNAEDLIESVRTYKLYCTNTDSLLKCQLLFCWCYIVARILPYVYRWKSLRVDAAKVALYRRNAARALIDLRMWDTKFINIEMLLEIKSCTGIT